MEQILITLESPEILALEKQQDKAALSKASKESVIRQIDTGTARVNSPAHGASSFALIIDGRSLAFALELDVEKSFIEMAMGCASVICCRSSPKQKALVTRLVKQGTRKTILAIGDGANDVGMLQEADIGVGIAGVEGMQAAMSSDVAIAQFRFLERLLLVHGHWCYRRISLMVLYFFYKNIVFGFILLWYEAYTSFSGQTLFNDWCMTFYNIFFTGLPVLALGVFDQDVSAKNCLRFPLLYQEGVKNVLFNWKQIFAWMFNAAYSSIIIFALCAKSLEYQAFRKDGEVASMDILGTMMFTCIVWIVNCQLALAVSYFTWIQHLFIWGSIAAWYLFLLVYGEITPTTSTTAFMILIEACGPAISYWLVTVLVVVSTLIPFLIYAYIQRRFFPMYHHMIQYMNFRGRDNDPEYCNSMHPPEFQHKTVGFSARKHDKEGHKKPELYRRKITNE